MSEPTTIWIIVGLLCCFLLWPFYYLLTHPPKSTLLRDNPFAAACYKQHTLHELIDALNAGPNEADMKEWNITPEEWIEQIELAIRKKKIATLIALQDKELDEMH